MLMFICQDHECFQVEVQHDDGGPALVEISHDGVHTTIDMRRNDKALTDFATLPTMTFIERYFHRASSDVSG